MRGGFARGARPRGAFRFVFSGGGITLSAAAGVLGLSGSVAAVLAAASPAPAASLLGLSGATVSVAANAALVGAGGVLGLVGSIATVTIASPFAPSPLRIRFAPNDRATIAGNDRLRFALSDRGRQ